MTLAPTTDQADSSLASRRRWSILAVIAIAQLMVVLDNTIVNIALPSAQADLGFSDPQRQWVITAYALAFGSLLLLGGRMSDLFGRKRAFMVGLIGFAVASMVGGAADGFEMLVISRAAQGAFGALLAPAALSLLTTTFPGGRDRARAFGVFSAIAGSGAALGLLLGGTLTEYVDWRWCMYVNAVFAVVAFVGAAFLLPALPKRERPHLDILGTVAGSAGLFCIVYGFATAETDGWSSGSVLGFLVGGVALLVTFVLLQRKVRAPLLPLRVVLDRNRGGAYLAILVLASGMFAVSLFLTYYLQESLHFSPVLTGVAFLPMVASIVTASTTVPATLLPRIGPKPLIFVGLLLGSGALFWLSQHRRHQHLRQQRRRAADPHGSRPGHRDVDLDQHRHPRGRPERRRGRLRLGQHHAAGRWVGRYRAALEHRRHRGRGLPRREPRPARARRRGHHPQLHRGVPRGVGAVRWSAPSSPGRSSGPAVPTPHVRSSPPRTPSRATPVECTDGEDTTGTHPAVVTSAPADRGGRPRRRRRARWPWPCSPSSPTRAGRPTARSPTTTAATA